MALNENEAVPVNNIGGGGIEGAGIGPQGEPGVYLRKRKLVNPIMTKTVKRFKEFTSDHQRSKR